MASWDRNLLLLFIAVFSCACANSGAGSSTPGHARTLLPSAISFDRPPSIPDLAAGKAVPPTPEEFQEQIAKSGRKWFYGEGIGKTMANVGTAVVFPPYALYLLGNAGLALAGCDQLYVTELLPQTPRKYVLKAYDGVTSVPGRINAYVAGEEFQNAGSMDAGGNDNSKTQGAANFD